MPLTGVGRFESVTVSTTAIGVTATVMDDGFIPYSALISVEDAAVRYRTDGTDPTAAVGHILEPGDVVTLTQRDELVRFRAIRRDGADATLRVTQGQGFET